MAGNIFDQFDGPSPPKSPASENIFDQFDTASLDASTGRTGQFAAPKLPQQMPAPSVSREGFLISEYDDGSFGAGALTRPIIEGIKNALPAAARYRPGTSDTEGVDALIQAVAPPAGALGPGSAGGLGWAGRTIPGSAPMIPPKKPAAEAARVAVDELKQAGRAAYQKADDAGVIFRPEGVGRVYDEAVDALTEFGYDPALHPKVARALERLAKGTEENVTMKGMDVLRKVAGNAARSTDPSERAAAQIVIDKIDDLMLSPRAGEALAGATDDAASAIREARTLWARMRKTELLEEAIQKAKDRASSTGSGGNENNAIRQNLRRLLDNPRTRRMFSKDEQDVIRSVVRGSKSMNVGRSLGKMSPETGGLMAHLATGQVGAGGAAALFTGNPLLAVPAVVMPTVGFVAKRMSDRGMNRSVDRLITMISSGQTTPVVQNWFDAVRRAGASSANQAQMRSASLILAQHLSRETGEDPEQIAAALMEGASAPKSDR